MKSIRWSLFLFAVCVLGSCSKEESNPTADGMVKLVDSVSMDAYIGMLPLDDGSYIVLNQGKMIKLNSRGVVAWKKPIAELVYVRTAVAIPGTGFAIFGTVSNPQTYSSLYVCRYDMEGNFLDRKTINVNVPAVYSSIPVILLPLSNGGYALAMSAIYFTMSSYLKILDSDFNLVYSRGITPPPGYNNFTVQNICETPGGGIALTGSMGGGNLDYSYINYAVILTEPNGIIKSYAIVGDSTSNEMSIALSPYPGGYFAATSSMSEWNSDDGSFVDYYSTTMIAGSLRIDKFNTEGQFTGSRALTGYPGFGIIRTIRKSSDGGYVLCGTVGNNGSSVSVSITKIFVCKLNSSLNQEWSKVIETTYQAIGVDALPAMDGSCLVTGNMKSFNTNYQMLMIKTDANGNY